MKKKDTKTTESSAPGELQSLRASPWKGTAFVTALFFLVPLIIHFYPIIPQFSSKPAGGEGDVSMNVWALWHAGEVVALHGDSFYSTKHVLAPLGTTLIYHTNALLPSILVSPVTLTVGVFAAYNLLLVLLVLFAGLGMFLLVREFTSSPLAAGFGAFVVELSPITYHKLLGHFSLLAFGFIPFTTWLLFRVFSANTKRSGIWFSVALGIAIFATFVTDYNIFIYEGFILGCCVVIQLIRIIRQKDPLILKTICLRLVIAFAIPAVAFIAWATISPLREAVARNDADYQAWEGNDLAADIAFYAIPNPRYFTFSKLLGDWIDEHGPENLEATNYLGIIPLLLLVPGLIANYRKRRSWTICFALIGGFALVFSIGLDFHLFSRAYYGPEALRPFYPFRLLLKVPILSQSRVPARWAITLFLFVTFFAACGFDALLSRRQRRWQRITMTGFLLLVCTLEFSHRPTPLCDPTYPSNAYNMIGKSSSPHDMIVEFPISFTSGSGNLGNTDTEVNMMRMFWATRHHYRIVSCHLARLSSERTLDLLHEPFLRDMWCIQEETPLYPAQCDPTPREDVHVWLKRNSVKYVIIDRIQNYRQMEKYLADDPVFARIFKDEDYSLYRVKVP